MDKSQVRQQILDVIVQQALAGVPWRSICKVLMDTNGITEDEVETQVAAKTMDAVHTGGINCPCRSCLVERATFTTSVQALWDAMPHAASGPCRCKQCMEAVVKIRYQIDKQCLSQTQDFTQVEALRRRQIAELPHSDTPPCACAQCWPLLPDHWDVEKK
jgi:hypothetical protein